MILRFIRMLWNWATTSMPSSNPPHPAASLVLIREQSSCLQVLLGRRHRNLRFMPGFHVFPGGRLEQQDFAAAQKINGPFSKICGLDGGLSSQDATAHILAAIRECREETGLAFSFDRLEKLKLRCVAQAITPAGSPVRFDTRFFLADGSSLSEVAHPSGELEEVGWYDLKTIGQSLKIADVTAFVLKESLKHWPLPDKLPRNHPAVPVMTYAETGPRITRPHTN